MEAQPLLKPHISSPSIGHFGILFVSIVFCVMSTLVFYIVDLSVVSLIYFIIILGITFYVTLIVYTKWREDISMSITQGLLVSLLYHSLNFFYFGYLLERHTNLVSIIPPQVFGSAEYGLFVVWAIVAFVLLPLVFIGYAIHTNYTNTSSEEKTLQMITDLENQLGEVKKSQENARIQLLNSSTSEQIQLDGQPLHPSSVFDTSQQYYHPTPVEQQTFANQYPSPNIEYQPLDQYNQRINTTDTGDGDKNH